ncbi:MAG TPA: hypothetical protein PLA90_05130, partial [Candidatus Sumerlaeota bacterium]|nr:hypothetical protein [Candidatus Sumerlaeota bacterium]
MTKVLCVSTLKPQLREQVVWNQPDSKHPEGEFQGEKTGFGREKNARESANGATLYQPGASP